MQPPAFVWEEQWTTCPLNKPFVATLSAHSHSALSAHSPIRSLTLALSPLSQTSIMAVEFAGGVIIGADSRTTTGSYIVSSFLIHFDGRTAHAKS
jgi:hypothetical protein